MGNDIEKIRINFQKTLDNIIFDSRKYSLIDRLFHFAIENSILMDYINSLVLSDEKKLELIHNSFTIYDEIDTVIDTIKNCYGIKSIDFHSRSTKILFLDNPSLLGISPFLFTQIEWQNIIVDEIKKLKYKSDDINPIYDIIKNCLDDTFQRLRVDEFRDLRYKLYSDEWSEDILTANDMFSLIVDKFIENSNKLDFDELQLKQEKSFLKAEMIKSSIANKIKINLPFDDADKIFKEFFKSMCSQERATLLYDDFSAYLKIIYKKLPLNTKLKSLKITEEEIKKLIKFFSEYKVTSKTLDNYFSYKTKDLFELMRSISGLEIKTTWDKAHSEDTYKVSEDLKQEINFIIPK